MISRRDFVRGGVTLVSIGTTAQSLLKGTVAFAHQHPNDVLAKNNGKILVLVQLAGGNDGLNTLVPIGDSVYKSARKSLAIPDSDILPLEGGYGFHPGLAGLELRLQPEVEVIDRLPK